MHFITSSYGNSYAALLAVCLQSLAAHAPQCPVTVYWQDTDDDIMEALGRLWPSVRFVRTTYAITGSNHQKIPAKMQLWAQAVVELSDSPLCLIDSDTVVCRSPEPLLEGADIVFTDKDEQFQLNTGVVLVRPSRAAEALFQDWMQETMRIIGDDQLLQQAISPENVYGAADQMALHRLLHYKKGKKSYSYPTAHGVVRLKAAPCSNYNQTNSVPLSPDIWIYHYKGGWRDILFHGIHSSYRPVGQCCPMQVQYLLLYREVLEGLQAHGIAGSTIRKLHIHVPQYFDMQRARVRPFRLWWRLGRDWAGKLLSSRLPRV